jgi:hypothetical protein
VAEGGFPYAKVFAFTMTARDFTEPEKTISGTQNSFLLKESDCGGFGGPGDFIFFASSYGDNIPVD